MWHFLLCNKYISLLLYILWVITWLFYILHLPPANQRPVFGSREQYTTNQRPVFRLHGDCSIVGIFLQPIRDQYLGHVNNVQPIRGRYLGYIITWLLWWSRDCSIVGNSLLLTYACVHYRVSKNHHIWIWHLYARLTRGVAVLSCTLSHDYTTALTIYGYDTCICK